VNCLGGGSGTWNSVGHNIADDGSCGLDQPSDQAGVDPLLGPLADNGGPTQTRAPEPGSPAIDQGFAGGLGPAIDQRGLRRTVDFLAVPNPAGGDGSDVGAVERQDVTAPTLRVGKARVNGRRRTVGLRFKVSDDATPKREILVRCKLDRKKPRLRLAPEVQAAEAGSPPDRGPRPRRGGQRGAGEQALPREAGEALADAPTRSTITRRRLRAKA
jgi:hypothetical protein